jgi:hypothetical protein
MSARHIEDIELVMSGLVMSGAGHVWAGHVWAGISGKIIFSLQLTGL